ERAVQGGAESERGAAVRELLLHARVPAALHRYRRPAFGTSAGQGKGRPHAAQQDQADEGRSGGGVENGRRAQGALRQAVPCLISSPHTSSCDWWEGLGGGGEWRRSTPTPFSIAEAMLPDPPRRFAGGGKQKVE